MADSFAIPWMNLGEPPERKEKTKNAKFKDERDDSSRGQLVAGRKLDNDCCVPVDHRLKKWARPFSWCRIIYFLPPSRWAIRSWFTELKGLCLICSLRSMAHQWLFHAQSTAQFKGYFSLPPFQIQVFKARRKRVSEYDVTHESSFFRLTSV